LYSESDSGRTQVFEEVILEQKILFNAFGTVTNNKDGTLKQLETTVTEKDEILKE
jgi:hypothetical protein